MVEVPPGLDHLRRTSEGAAWLEELPDIVERCINRWSLVLRRVYPDGGTSWVAEVAWRGELAALRIQWPGGNAYQTAALQAWAGEGAVRVLATAKEDRSCLLERCWPGTYLAERPPEEALDVLVKLLPRHWVRPKPTFPEVASEVNAWLKTRRESSLSASGLDARVVARAVEMSEYLVSTEQRTVLVNDDLHPWNVLRAEREDWLVIDPAPLLGEREFGLAPIVRCPELGHSRLEVLHRLHFLCDELGLDRTRARGWALFTAASRATESGARPHLAEVSRWLAEDSA